MKSFIVYRWILGNRLGFKMNYADIYIINLIVSFKTNIKEHEKTTNS